MHRTRSGAKKIYISGIEKESSRNVKTVLWAEVRTSWLHNDDDEGND